MYALKYMITTVLGLEGESDLEIINKFVIFLFYTGFMGFIGMILTLPPLINDYDPAYDGKKVGYLVNNILI